MRSWRSRARQKVAEHTAVDRTKLEPCCEKSSSSPSRFTSYTLSKFDVTNFQILEAPAMSTTLGAFLFCFHFFPTQLSIMLMHATARTHSQFFVLLFFFPVLPILRPSELLILQVRETFRTILLHYSVLAVRTLLDTVLNLRVHGARSLLCNAAAGICM